MRYSENLLLLNLFHFQQPISAKTKVADTMTVTDCRFIISLKMKMST